MRPVFRHGFSTAVHGAGDDKCRRQRVHRFGICRDSAVHGVGGRKEKTCGQGFHQRAGRYQRSDDNVRDGIFDRQPAYRSGRDTYFAERDRIRRRDGDCGLFHGKDERGIHHGMSVHHDVRDRTGFRTCDGRTPARGADDPDSAGVRISRAVRDVCDAAAVHIRCEIRFCKSGRCDISAGVGVRDGVRLSVPA